MNRNPVDETMERAHVSGADPPQFSSVDPASLKSLVEHSSGLNLTAEEVDLGVNGSEVLWLFDHRPDGVEVTLFSADTHETAVQRMRNALSVISAPLDMLFISTLRLGQCTLEAVGGRGLILFVRGNVFIELVGMASSEELGKVAVEVDRFLKERETDPSSSIARPLIQLEQPSHRRVRTGETFEIVVAVAEVGWMTAHSHAMVAQLLEIDHSRAAFKFQAGVKGACDIRLMFSHEKTLQTATVTVHVEVVEGDA